jgi:hypothetical protein
MQIMGTLIGSPPASGTMRPRSFPPARNGADRNADQCAMSARRFSNPSLGRYACSALSPMTCALCQRRTTAALQSVDDLLLLGGHLAPSLPA